MNITEIINKIKATVDNHNLGEEGKYARWLWQNERGTRDLGLDEYGCADAANILYTIGEFISEPEKRAKWIETLQHFQDPETGLFYDVEKVHHPFHTTSQCIGALELFDAAPKYSVTAMLKYRDKDELIKFLEGLKWAESPAMQSHQGAGLFPAMVLTKSVPYEWKCIYLDWLWENTDPVTGLWRKGCLDNKSPWMHYHIVGSFHYLFICECEHRPMRYPERIIDTCIELYKEKRLGDQGLDNDTFGQHIRYMEMDWVYMLNRASRQTGYRFNDVKECLREFSKGYIEFLNGIDEKTNDAFNDLHRLFGTVCALAELQQALPGELETEKPLKLVLDRRPFI